MYCNFDLHFPNKNNVNHIFICLFGHLYVFFGDMFIKILFRYYIEFMSFYCRVVRVLYIFWIQVLIRCIIFKYFLSLYCFLIYQVYKYLQFKVLALKIVNQYGKLIANGVDLSVLCERGDYNRISENVK